MAEGVAVPIEKLRSTADVLAALSRSADELAEGLTAADPPDALWGGLGLLMKWKYDEKADEARRHVRKISEALDSQGSTITANAASYEELDVLLQQAFDRFRKKLSGEE